MQISLVVELARRPKHFSLLIEVAREKRELLNKPYFHLINQDFRVACQPRRREAKFVAANTIDRGLVQ